MHAVCNGSLLELRPAGRRFCRQRGCRSGFSMLEMMAVIVILGLLAAMAVARMDSSTLGNMASRVVARQMALDLMQARRRAIATGENHRLALQAGMGGHVGYTMEQGAAGSATAVDEYFAFPSGVVLVISPNSSPEFDFQGEALAAYTITVAGPQRTWQIDVYQLTGAVKVTEP